MTITTTPIEDGKRIRIDFTYDPAVVAAVKAIPGAKFDGRSRSWSISKRYAKHLEAVSAAATDADAAYAVIADAAVAVADMREIGKGHVSVTIDTARRRATVRPIGGTYLRAIGQIRGAESFKDHYMKFAGYTVPVSGGADLDHLVAQVGAVVREYRAKIAEREQEATDRRVAQQAELERRFAESVARAEADRAAGRGRMGVLADRAPAVGAVLRHGQDVVRVTGLGKIFRLDDDASSMGWPSGHEGERACYAYYERATPDEVAALEASEAEAKRVAEIRRRQSEAVATVRTSNDRPAVGHVPEGEVLWRDDRHRATGWASHVVLTADGWIWHAQYDGTDGGAWGDYNLGYNTRGGRVPATPEMIAAIRGEGAET